MNEELQTAVSALEEKFSIEKEEFRGEVSLIISSDELWQICQVLREIYDFKFLEVLTAVDYWPEQDPRFHVVYKLYSIEKNLRIGLRVPVSGIEPSLPTLVGLFQNANRRE